MSKYISLNEKIFVAGSSGMAGSAIVRQLYKQGYGNSIHNGIIYTPSRKELDLSDLKAVEEWFNKFTPSVVILAAAKVGGIFANASYPGDFILENLKIQTNLVEVAWKYNVKRLLFLGSSCIYPKFSKQPIKEEHLMDSKLEKTNEAYAIAKIAGIKLCQFLREQYGFDAISLMPTNLYGEGDNYHPEESHVMASLIRKFCEGTKNKSPYITCWGSGRPLREFMHVDDLASAVIFALEKWNPDSKDAPLSEEGVSLTHLNVGTGIDISIKDLALKIAETAKYEGEIKWDRNKPDGTPRKNLDISKITKLGWEPKIKLEEGIKKTVEKFFQENN